MAPDGSVADVKRADRNAAHKIIEQFMICCNETVAAYMAAAKIPCVYRIHENPSEEKVRDFYTFIGILGFRAPGRTDSVRPMDFQRLLGDAKGAPSETVIRKVMLRSMQKAIYSEKNAGHFGLASKCYCHFTSPIRRYPDLMTHRVLKAAIAGRLDEKTRLRYRRDVMDVSRHSSLRERAAEQAERDIDHVKKTEYMTKHVGEEFDAAVSGVTNFGIFVELNNTVEGLIRIDTLPGGPYTYLEKRYMLKGRRRSYTLGDKLRVQCTRADPQMGHIDFVVIGET
jgi:ribonuclease R